ncbi:Os05g0487600, partial [Oryza sativa Japonica Group]
EIVNIRLGDGTTRCGQILEVDGERGCCAGHHFSILMKILFSWDCILICINPMVVALFRTLEVLLLGYLIFRSLKTLQEWTTNTPLCNSQYKGGAAEGGRRPIIWNIFEQRSTPAPCASFTTCSGPGFLPVVF